MLATNNSGHRQRLRMRLLHSSGNALEDYELLELLLFASHPRGDVKWIAKSLFFHFDGDLRKIFSATLNDFLLVDSVTDSVASVFLCCSVLFNRILSLNLQHEFFINDQKDANVINNFSSLLNYSRSRLSSIRREYFLLLYLNSAAKIVSDEFLDCGTLDKVLVYTREVIQRVICRGARSLIVVHNHPSGIVKPSHSDISLTKDLVISCKSVGVNLIDHLILSNNDYFSFFMSGSLS